jgi:hypothetical protein
LPRQLGWHNTLCGGAAATIGQQRRFARRLRARCILDGWVDAPRADQQKFLDVVIKPDT